MWGNVNVVSELNAEKSLVQSREAAGRRDDRARPSLGVSGGLESWWRVT